MQRNFSYRDISTDNRKIYYDLRRKLFQFPIKIHKKNPKEITKTLAKIPLNFFKNEPEKKFS